jgi:Mn2+/Fe2+ NRAMP family transporter
MLAGVSGLAFVWFGSYLVLERVMTMFVGLMFLTVVGLGIYLAPGVGDVTSGLVPALPPGAGLYTLGLIGGVGGTITMAAYGYWVNSKGWIDERWMRAMRWDNAVAYAMTGLFVIAMLIVGAELLHAAEIALTQGDRGLLDLAEVLEDRFGWTVSVVFLVGFFAAAYSSVLGVWHGVSLLFADLTAHWSGTAGHSAVPRDRSVAFRAYALWLTFPPMVLFVLGRPFHLVVAYGVLGSFFMPFLAITLLWLLNSSQTPRRWRNSPLANAGLVAAALLFGIVSANEVWMTVAR